MGSLPLRLHPGDDLRGALEAAAKAAGWVALPGWRFQRVADAANGWAERQVRPGAGNGDDRR